jgi:hypothetical protein
MMMAAGKWPARSAPGERRRLADRVVCLAWTVAALAGWAVALLVLAAAPGIR